MSDWSQWGNLSTMCLSSGVTGFEKEFSIKLSELFKKYCDWVQTDSFSNTIGFLAGHGVNKKKIMLSAHLDEIGFIVKSIDEKGFIRLANIGGFDGKTLLAKEVTIHGKENLYGIIGAKPPHLLTREESDISTKVKDLSVDTGLSVERLKEIVRIGDVVTLKGEFIPLANDRFSSKALDNRLGVAILLNVMQRLNGERPFHDIFFVASSQEEFDLAGITTVAFTLKPDAAMVLDACHGNMPDCSKDDTYALGKGPVISVGPNLHRKLTDGLIQSAKDLDIPYQISPEPGDTGTEAWATQVSGAGIPTVLLSIPVRYMHTTIETADGKDLENSSSLICGFIENLGIRMEEWLCY